MTVVSLAAAELLITRYLAGDCTPKDQADLADWLRADPAHRQIYLDALVLDTHLQSQMREVLTLTARHELRRLRPGRRSRKSQRKPLRLVGVPLFTAGLIAAALVLIVVMVQNKSIDDTGDIPPLVMQGLLRVESSDWQPGDRLRGGEEIIADGDGSLIYADGGRVAVIAGTRITLGNALVGTPRMYVQSGKIACDLPGQPHGFVVQAGSVAVTVVGTVFQVERQRDAVAVDVTQGQVSVTHQNRTVLLGPGEYWPFSRNSTPQSHVETLDGWISAGDHASERSATSLRIAGAQPADQAQNTWSGRSLRRATPLAVAESWTLTAHIDYNARQSTSHAELFLAAPDSTYDKEGQALTCVRLGLRGQTISVHALQDGPDSADIPWSARIASGPHILALQCAQGVVQAHVDGVTVWTGAIAWTTAVPGVRLARKRSESEATSFEQVTLHTKDASIRGPRVP